LIWRNKGKEAKMDGPGPIDDSIRRLPDLQVRVDKQRTWDYRGTLNYWINRRTLRFLEYGNTADVQPFL
jgi:hypothetical protein